MLIQSKRFLILVVMVTLVQCLQVSAQYKGTASVTQGLGTTVTTNLLNCTGGRVAAVGTIKASDGTTWTVPAVVQYQDALFPFAPDLYNDCNDNKYASYKEALSKLTDKNIVVVDNDGEVITAFIFADNYFEMYINGIPVGKDAVPFTTFNSSIVLFRVKQPFTIAMKLVDWEERLGLGSENNNGFAYHAGDGGMVAVFKDSLFNTVAVTNKHWKAQTFYTAPITDLSCPAEQGAKRLSSNCSAKDTQDGSKYYGLHWSIPAGWMNREFNDTDWPNATEYTNQEIGVDNKPAYTNFTTVFDDGTNDAQFIWSTNVVLDNEVLVRYTVGSTTSVEEDIQHPIRCVPNPVGDNLTFSIRGLNESDAPFTIQVYSVTGEVVFEQAFFTTTVHVPSLSSGVYMVRIITGNGIRWISVVVQ
ncbi:MAG: T9SS type A sorting domain-containing protein [Candidatus Kapabacteria bacterium]|nr:T9SS type A sorting domain-containing protein [Candidatus Kapabacteria bacterium]